MNVKQLHVRHFLLLLALVNGIYQRELTKVNFQYSIS